MCRQKGFFADRVNDCCSDHPDYRRDCYPEPAAGTVVFAEQSDGFSSGLWCKPRPKILLTIKACRLLQNSTPDHSTVLESKVSSSLE
jgi:hypothetical protein